MRKRLDFLGEKKSFRLILFSNERCFDVEFNQNVLIFLYTEFCFNKFVNISFYRDSSGRFIFSYNKVYN